MTELVPELRDRPVFICGHPKAGTSLVRAVLDSHPQLIVYPEETVFFRRFLPRSVGLDLEAQLELADQTIIHIFDWNPQAPSPSQEGFLDRDYTAISHEEVRQTMRELVDRTCRHPGDILSAAVLAFGQISGQAGKCWVEKSPYNEYFTEQIFTWWPKARCIHVIRDPRDNYLSYRRKHPDWSSEFFAANWRRSTRAGVQNQRRFGAQHYRLLRYEDLTRAPEETLEQLAGYLEIDWDASLDSPTRAGQGWAGNSMFADQFQGISAAPVARWKEQLNPQEASVIERMAKPLLEDFNYSPANTTVNTQTLIASWRAVTWPIRRRFRRRTTRISATSDRGVKAIHAANSLKQRISLAGRILLGKNISRQARREIPAITPQEVAEARQFFPLEKFFIFGHARSGHDHAGPPDPPAPRGALQLPGAFLHPPAAAASPGRG